MRAAILAAAVLVCGGAASAQAAEATGPKQAIVQSSDWQVVECRRGADAKRAVRRQFGRLDYVKARDVLDGPRFEGARCMSKLEYWRLGRALDVSQGSRFASVR